MCGRLSSSRVTVPWLVDLRTGSRWVTCRGIAPTRRRMIVIFSVSGAGCHPPFSALLVNTASAVHRLREFTVGKLWLRGRDGFFCGRCCGLREWWTATKCVSFARRLRVGGSFVVPGAGGRRSQLDA